MVLSINNLTGFGGGGAPIVSTFQSAQQVTVVTSVGTWDDAPIGTESSDRYVIVAWSVDNNDPGMTHTATLGGNAMTSIFYYEDSDSYVGFFGIAYPTGTTADFVITGTGGTLRNQLCCAIWSVTGMNSLTPTDTDGARTQSASPHTAAMTATSSNNITFGVCGDRVIGVTGFTWTGATEHADINLSSSNHTFASVANQPAGTVNVTCTPAAANAYMATISFSQ